VPVCSARQPTLNLNLPRCAPRRPVPPWAPMRIAAHTVLLGENADAQACVAAALPPMALGRLRRTCRSASCAAPVGVDWARLGQPSELDAAGELRALQYLYVHDKEHSDPWVTLRTAADQGRGAVVAWILEQEDIQLAPYTLLDVAASTSDPEVLRLLLPTGPAHSSAALLRAVQCGNLTFLTALLDTGVHPDSEVALHGGPRYGIPRYGGTRGTALMEATREGHLECVQLLLRHKAYVHAWNDWGATALNFSKTGKGDQTACTRELLAAGADVNAADNGGRTALMQAALYGNRSLSPLVF